MIHWIVNWLVAALALWLMAQIMPGIQIREFKTALITTIVLAVIESTIGLVISFIALPLTIITLGLFTFVLKALFLKLTSLFTPGFRIDGFLNAVLGALVLTVLDIVLRRVVWASL